MEVHVLPDERLTTASEAEAETPPAPLGLDELALNTLLRAIDRGLTGRADSKFFIWLLKLDCKERAAHRGAFGWFNVQAKPAAEAVDTSDHRIRDRLRKFNDKGYLRSLHEEPHFHIWIRHNNQTPPPPPAPEPPQREEPAPPLFAALDKAEDASIHLVMPGDAPALQPGSRVFAVPRETQVADRQQPQCDDGRKTQPAGAIAGTPPDGRGIDHDGSGPLSGPPPSSPDEGERSFSAHQTGARTKLVRTKLVPAHQFGAHQTGARTKLVRALESSEEEEEEKGSLYKPAHARAFSPYGKKKINPLLLQFRAVQTRLRARTKLVRTKTVRGWFPA